MARPRIVTATSITLAANNAEIGGGEVMLLHLAASLRELGLEPQVVGPRMAEGASGGVLDAAEQAGYAVTRLASARRDYVRDLREWDRTRRRGVLWCNGLLPAVATTGRRGRVVHLHQQPAAAHGALRRAASAGALATLVPSRHLARQVKGSTVLWNWTGDLTPRLRSVASPGATATGGAGGTGGTGGTGALTIGFLGRPGPAKGVDVLGKALGLLEARSPGRFRLLLAGEAHFVGTREEQQLDRALTPVAHLVDRRGWMDRAEWAESIDIAAFPSRAPESFGLVAAEALGLRTPFVISDAGALTEVAGPEHPFVARTGDAHDLARVLEEAAATAAGEHAAYLDRGRTRWEQHFSPGAGRDRVRRLLVQLALV